MASLNNSFKKLPRLVQFILLIIPGVGWITEIVVRLSAFIHGKGLNQIIALLLAIFIPIFSWIDLVWVLLFKKLILTWQKNQFGVFPNFFLFIFSKFIFFIYFYVII